MDDLIGELWERSLIFLTREEFAKSLEGWTFDPFYEDGEMAIVFLVKGDEFHFATLKDGFKATKAHLAKYPGSIIEKYGYAVTRTPKEDLRQRRFNERLGFRKVGEDEWDIHYRIDKMRTKEKTCQ